MTDKTKKDGLGWAMWCGITASGLYAVGAISILIMNVFYNPPSPSPSMRLNEIGDYLAGAFSPLAFLWLVIGYLMQNSELKLNRISIERQANELESTTKIQLKRERKFFDSNQPIIEIKLFKVSIDESNISIFFSNLGSRATNATFSSQFMNDNILEKIDIDKGSNSLDLFYYDFRNRIEALNLLENDKKELDKITIDYVDSSNLQQRSQLTIYIIKLPTLEYKFEIKIQQYFDGELLD
ncbi:hypothetical protein [Marinomonas transparens]|uniref:Uncharacterized protein n=1 Tax=Marinomonas transparens TaxID=2795388 RepID=A0A934JVY9_9GAMM|nr:hypothetical protein [Marinomonas transparens]MBJ7539267.1 hypothetical protein [Marinomonas transparens]